MIYSVPPASQGILEGTTMFVQSVRVRSWVYHDREKRCVHDGRKLMFRSCGLLQTARAREISPSETCVVGASNCLCRVIITPLACVIDL